jgi:hypothetical protein
MANKREMKAEEYFASLPARTALNDIINVENIIFTDSFNLPDQYTYNKRIFFRGCQFPEGMNVHRNPDQEISHKMAIRFVQCSGKVWIQAAYHGVEISYCTLDVVGCSTLLVHNLYINDSWIGQMRWNGRVTGEIRWTKFTTDELEINAEAEGDACVASADVRVKNVIRTNSPVWNAFFRSLVSTPSIHFTGKLEGLK